MQNLNLYEEHINFIAASTGEAPKAIKDSLKDIKQNVPKGIPDHADFWLSSRINIPTAAACAAIAPAALLTRQAIFIQLGRIFDNLRNQGLQKWNPKVASALMTANAVEVVAIRELELQVIDSDHSGNLMISLAGDNDTRRKKWTLGMGCRGNGGGSIARDQSIISLLSHKGDVSPDFKALIKALSSIRDPSTRASTSHQASLNELLQSHFSAALAMDPSQIRAFLATYEGFCQRLEPSEDRLSEYDLQPALILNPRELPNQDWVGDSSSALVKAAHPYYRSTIKKTLQQG